MAKIKNPQSINGTYFPERAIPDTVAEFKSAYKDYKCFEGWTAKEVEGAYAKLTTKAETAKTEEVK